MLGKRTRGKDDPFDEKSMEKCEFDFRSDEDKSKTTFHCELCNVASVDEITFRGHLNGKKHIKKLRQLKSSSSAVINGHIEEESVDQIDRCHNDSPNSIQCMDCRMHLLEILQIATTNNVVVLMNTEAEKNLIAQRFVSTRVSSVVFDS
jgi:hypothetical protein